MTYIASIGIIASLLLWQSPWRDEAATFLVQARQYAVEAEHRYGPVVQARAAALLDNLQARSRELIRSRLHSDVDNLFR